MQLIKHIFVPVFLVSAFVTAMSQDLTLEDEFEVAGPVFLAVLCPDSVEASSDAAEVLPDYFHHLELVSQAIEAEGIEYHYFETCSLDLIGDVEKFSLSGVPWGYCFAAPGKDPRIIEGVWTDIDLLLEAYAYFGIERY